MDNRGVLFDTEKKILLYTPSNLSGSYIIPDGVFRIGDKTFLNCMELKNIIISGSVTEIGDNVFYGTACEEQVRYDYPNLFE